MKPIVPTVAAFAVAATFLTTNEYSLAQNTTLVQSTSPLVQKTSTVSSAVVIEPKARELLRQMSAAYSGLRSFSCEVKSQRSFGKTSRRETSRVQWQRPRRVAVEHFEKFSPSPRLIHKRLLADKWHVFVDYEGRGEYKGALDDGRNLSRNLVHNLSNVTPFLDERNWLQTLLNQNQQMPPQAQTRSVQYGGVTKINGAINDRVDCKSQDGTFSLYLDRRTHLVRRSTYTPKGYSIGSKAVGGLDYLNIRLNPTLAPTVFQLPRGAKVNGVSPAVALREMSEENRLKLPNFSDFKVVPRVDAKARAIVAQMLQTTQNLDSFQGVLTSGFDGRTAIAWQYPNQFRLRNDASYGNLNVTTAVSDGKTVSRLMQGAAQSIEYSKQAVPTDYGQVVDPFKPVEVHDAGVPNLLFTNNIMVKDAWLDSPQMVVLKKPQFFDGVRVQTIVLASVEEYEKQSVKSVTTLLIGERDHLLRLYERQDNASWRESGIIQRSRQILTRVRANQNLPASLFRFAPPSGAKLVKARFPLESQVVLREGKTAPKVQAKDLSGASFSVEQYRGKVLLLDFWATWCGPCVEEMPNVQAVYQKYHAQGFDVVGVSHDVSRSKLTSFLQKHDLPWRQIFALDEKSATSLAFGVGALPSTVLIGRNGKIVATNLRGGDLEAAVEAAIH